MTTATLESRPLRRVSQGISSVFYGLQLSALAVLGGFVVPFALAGDFALAMKVILGLGILSIVAGLLGLYGKALCVASPSEMRGKEFIYAAVIMDVLAIVIQLASQFTSVPRIIAESTTLLWVAGLACFLFYLARLGRFVHDDELATRAAGLIKIGVAVAATLALSFASVFTMPAAGGLFVLVALILGVLGLIRYSRLLLDFRKRLAAD